MKNVNKRNYGVDIARILSMLMVVFLHNLLNGGILKNLDIIDNPFNMIYWIIENFSIVAVNIFAIITGYLMVGKKVHYKKLVSLWKNVIFWSIFICVIFYFLGYPLKTHTIIISFFPTIMKNYWYFNAYIMLVLFIPFLNAGIKAIDFLLFEKIVFCLTLFSVTMGLIGHWFELGGYSGIWLMILYLIGSYIKMSPRVKRLKSIHLISAYSLSMIISLLAEYVSIRYIGGEERWLNYLSPMVVLSSVTLFILLTRIDIKNEKVKRLVSVISPLTFTVYLIDTHPVIFYYIIKNNFKWITELGTFQGVFILLIISILMFISFLMLEYIRVYIFQLLSKLVKFKKNRN
ncbi:acyltransferase family protein [Latilactobacillus sakei]|uniref:acyltransferase n=1 Tax=Latilactobacillus sakei TaxID=1599 RepID=UPI0015F68970|nr:acyltransferase family protein [Latilactobacillus sakei]QMU87147.1 acyltransferase family protein [Latilactobacillus sakei]